MSGINDNVQTSHHSPQVLRLSLSGGRLLHTEPERRNGGASSALGIVGSSVGRVPLKSSFNVTWMTSS